MDIPKNQNWQFSLANKSYMLGSWLTMTAFPSFQFLLPQLFETFLCRIFGFFVNWNVTLFLCLLLTEVCFIILRKRVYFLTRFFNDLARLFLDTKNGRFAFQQKVSGWLISCWLTSQMILRTRNSSFFRQKKGLPFPIYIFQLGFPNNFEEILRWKSVLRAKGAKISGHEQKLLFCWSYWYPKGQNKKLNICGYVGIMTMLTNFSSFANSSRAKKCSFSQSNIQGKAF